MEYKDYYKIIAFAIKKQINIIKNLPKPLAKNPQPLYNLFKVK